MSGKLILKKPSLGTSAVFFTAISTILGAIMFLRFGYAVGQLGFWGSVALIILGHLVTIPTAMAIAEIATNQKVEGGGEYFIISRSFGLNIGGAIGVTLFLSQAISVAFYIIAFAQAFEPIFHILLVKYNIYVYSIKAVTIPTLIILVLLIIKKGAAIGLQTLYFVVAILFVSLLLFFLGTTQYEATFAGSFPDGTDATTRNFFVVFAICFPGFTGMTAGVGLSGDLKNPSKGIPIGTLVATIVGMIIYIAIVYKLASSASVDALADPSNQLIMQDIALWGPIIPIGLAAATISSAIGSILVAPRTLQALGNDKIIPLKGFGSFVSKNSEASNEPINATIITAIMAFAIVLVEDVNVVAEIISMFFMVTYGAICLISFLEHFSGDPSYRPSFRSRLYLSLLGSVLCVAFMFSINPLYAILSILLMVVIYFGVSFAQESKQGISNIFQGVISQLSRKLQVFLQKVEKDQVNETWRPSVVCISKQTFDMFGAFDLLRWISQRYGFGTYIHRIDDYVSKETNDQSDKDLTRLIKLAGKTQSNVFLDTLIAPSFTQAISYVLQLPGISGKENNMILFEFDKANTEPLTHIVDNFQLVKSTDFDVCILGSTIRGFGAKKTIHIWITSNDYENANLMILIGYIILGHSDWKKGKIKIMALYPEAELQEQKKKLLHLIGSGRLPISSNNIELVAKKEDQDYKAIINQNSQDADLTILGFRNELVKKKGVEVFDGFDNIGETLFINTNTQKEIK
jgi:solute carrier family 12 sodium/potassium/chloride transporter 2